MRGGSIREQVSIITPENGFGNSTYLPPGTGSASCVAALLKGGGLAAHG